MKKIILSISLALSLQNVFSQTATSVQNGSWLNPTTWNCSCIPVMNYSVVINHTVTLNTSMSFTSATSGLYIGANGALLQDANRDILIAGGKFTNFGSFDARYFYTQSGSFSMNKGIINLSAFTNSIYFSNDGTISVDSMTNTSTFDNNGVVNADSLTNTISGTFNNYSIANLQWSINYGQFSNFIMYGIAHTNNGNFQNYDTIALSNGLWNAGNFINNSSSAIHLGGGFYNYDPSTNKAVFQNDGKVDVLDSWYNTDTVKGNGCFTVQDSSVNSGYMKGAFSFVDNTPLGAIVDYNLGSIASGINTNACTMGISQISSLNSQISIYPNPANSILNIEVSSSSAAYRELTVYDILGHSVLKSEIKNQNTSVDINSLTSGMYYLKIGNSTQKFVKE